MPTSKDLTDLDSQLKKTLISAESFKRGGYMDPSKSLANIHKTIGTLASHTRKLVIRVSALEKTVNNNSRKITSLKNISKTQSERISGTNVGAKLPGSSTSNVEDNISAITKSVSSIAEILAGRKKLLDSTAAYDRRKAEQEKRALAESKLEKRFEGLKKAAEKVIAPVKSLLDKIINFFVTVFLGRVVYKLIEWFGDPSNAKKVNSIIRFLGDHWPKLLSLYLVFGTSFGRFAKGLIKAVTLGGIKLVGLIAKLAAARKIRGARRVAGFLGGGRGRVLANVAGTALAVGGTYAATQALKGPDEEPKAQAYKGGGYVIPKIPTFKGGGLNFKGMLGGASLGAMFGPLGMLLGGALGSGKPQEILGGFVSGEKGVDKIPAMLSDGEFVMSRGAVAKYGVDTLEAMNAAGGGTNKPKIMSGTTYAAGGGPIGYSAGDRTYGSERYDLTTGFRGETSKSDIYLVRAINELIKVLKNKFPDSSAGGGGRGSYANTPSGGSGRSSVGLGESISRVYQRASAKASKGIDSAKKAAANAAKKAEPLMRSLPARVDYGSLYLRSQLGGLGGSITESDLSKQTKDEYARAFEVAKSKVAVRKSGIESQIRQYQGLLKAPNLTPQQKAEYEKQLKVNQSRLAKYKAGQIDVQYEDFKDENGNLSAAAKAAQKTLGAVWATPTKDGGIQIEKEPYDFPIVKDPLGLMMWPMLNKKQKEAWLKKNEGSPHAKQLKANPNAWGSQKIAEAMYTLNPFATPVETDVKIGGTPRAKGVLDKFANILDNPLLSMSRGLAMNLLKGKERDVVTGEAERGSLMDKMFPSEKRRREEFVKNNPTAKLYDKPQKNTGQSYKSRFARPKNAGVKPVQPPTSAKPRVVYGPPVPSSSPKYQGKGARSRTRTPNFNASNNSRPKINILGIRI